MKFYLYNMDTHVLTICAALLLASSSLAANALAYLLTEVRPLPIQVKPFTCWGCMSFWLSTLFGVIVAELVPPFYRTPEAQTVAVYGCVGASVLLGLVNYFYIKAKYQVYE